jgi:hypothetical protein
MVIKNIKMRRTLTILLLICSLTASADKWYIATTGSDTHGKGTVADPWLTLHHAADTVLFSGDTISVGAGTFTETTQSPIAVGVSIYGAGATSIITSSEALSPIILLSSVAEGTDGSQSISYLTIDGNITAVCGIGVYARKNVSVHHVTFIDTETTGLFMCGLVSGAADGAPAVYATGNSIYDCTFTNCSKEWFEDPYYYASGAVGLGGQSGLLFYDNTIDCTTGGAGRAGYGIKYDDGGYNMGIKIYDNVISIKAKTQANNQWSYAIEFWNQKGGIEIYRNTIQGAVDMGGALSDDGGSYGFCEKIYDNVFSWPALQAYSQAGITIESDVSGKTYIYNNRFTNYSSPIAFSQISGANDVCNDVYIYYNIFQETATTAGNYTGDAIVWSGSSAGATYDNIWIWNNTIFNSTYIAKAGIRNELSNATLTDVEIKNNMIIKCYNAIQFNNHTVTGIDVMNNNLYGYTNDTCSFTDATVTEDVFSGNVLTTDPLFVSTTDFHLQAGSPAINAGIDLGKSFITTDYSGHHKYGAAWDIGAYEYGQRYLKNSGKLVMDDEHIVTIIR